MANSSGIQVAVKSLSEHGKVSAVISSTVFKIAGLAGYGDSWFANWLVYVVRQVAGAGAAPQGEAVTCTAYVSATGQFTIITQFGVDLTVGDDIYLIHPYLGSNTVTTVYPSNNVKQTSAAVETTTALAYTKVKELAFTGVQGGARITFDLKVDNAAGQADAIIYINGAPSGIPTVFTDATGVFQTFTQDIYGLVAGDLVQIYALVDAIPRIASVQNFTIGYDIITFPSVALAMDGVYIDVVNGTPGAAWPLGSPGFPVNNWADAQIIAAWRNTSKFVLVGGPGTITFTATQVLDLVGSSQYNLVVSPGIVVEFTGDVVAKDITNTTGNVIVNGNLKAEDVTTTTGDIDVYGDSQLNSISNGTGTVTFWGKCFSYTMVNVNGFVYVYGTCTVPNGITNTSGTISVQGNLVASDITNATGVIYVFGTTQVSGNIQNTGAGTIDLNISVWVGGGFTNATGAIIVQGNTQVITGSVTNGALGTFYIYGNLEVDSGDCANTTGNMYVSGDVQLGSGNLTNTTGALEIGGSVKIGDNGVLTNTSGTIEIWKKCSVYQYIANAGAGIIRIGGDCDCYYLSNSIGTVTLFGGLYAPSGYISNGTTTTTVWGDVVVDHLINGAGTIDINGSLQSNRNNPALDNIANILGTITVTGIAQIHGVINNTGTFTYKGLQPETAVNVTAIVAGVDVLNLAAAAGTHYIVSKLRLKCADPGVDTVTIRLYERVNGALTLVATNTIDTTKAGYYFSLADMFGVNQLVGDNLQVTAIASANSYAVTASYSWEKK